MSIEIVDGQVEGRSANVPIRDYLPADSKPLKTMLWVHGGGFSSGGRDQAESHEPAKRWAERGIHVRTLDYRLAPRGNPFKDPDLTEHPNRFPAALHDVVDVAEALATQVDSLISIGGASAGANLAAAATLVLRDLGKTPEAAFLAYGTFHAVLPENETVESELRGFLTKWAFNPQMFYRMNVNYVGSDEALKPGLAFPGGADLSGFPRSLVVNSSNDRLRKSGARFAEELREHGVAVSEHTLEGSHAFLNKPKSESFELGVNLAAEWILRSA